MDDESKRLSQKTLVRMMEVLSNLFWTHDRLYNFLYEHDFPDWFVTHARTHYDFNWQRILVDLRNTRFFFPGDFADSSHNITGDYLGEREAVAAAEVLILKLAGLTATLQRAEALRNALQLDGYAVDAASNRLIPLEGPVSAHEEEDALNSLVESSALPNAATIRKHMSDAHSLFVDGKHHPSLGESRNILQALIDGISVVTDRKGGHPVGLPAGTANRIDYLGEVEFLTSDENSAFRSAWGALSAGSHPGVPEREEARIGLVLALEFGQLLLIKWQNWSANGYRTFSKAKGANL